MKLTDKRFGIFEFMMLLCGILTTCIEALNYGISLFDLMGHLLVFPLCFCMGGIATWKIIKRSRVWLLSGFSLLFSFFAYGDRSSLISSCIQYMAFHLHLLCSGRQPFTLSCSLYSLLLFAAWHISG